MVDATALDPELQSESCVGWRAEHDLRSRFGRSVDSLGAHAMVVYGRRVVNLPAERSGMSSRLVAAS